MIKVYLSHFRMAIQNYTKPKGSMTNNKKGSPIHAISEFNQKCTKRALIVWTTSTSKIPIPIADEPKSIKQRIKETE